MFYCNSACSPEQSLLILLPIHLLQAARADAAQPDWRGDAADNAVPVFIADRLAFASGAGRVKVNYFDLLNFNFNALNMCCTDKMRLVLVLHTAVTVRTGTCRVAVQQRQQSCLQLR